MNTWYFLIKRDPGVIICSQPFWSSFLSLPLFFISGQSARPSKPLILNTGVKHLAWPGCCSSLFLMWFGSFFYSNQSRMAFCRCMKTAGSIKPLILAMPMVLRWVAAGQHHSYLNWFLLHWYQCLYFQYSIGPNWITPESAWTTNSIKIDRVGFYWVFFKWICAVILPAKIISSWTPSMPSAIFTPSCATGNVFSSVSIFLGQSTRKTALIGK